MPTTEKPDEMAVKNRHIAKYVKESRLIKLNNYNIVQKFHGAEC